MQRLWLTVTTGHIYDDMFRIMLVHVTYVKRGKTQAVEKRAYMKRYLAGEKFEQIAIDITGPFPKS